METKIYELPYGNATHPATYKQIKWLMSYPKVTSEVSTTQLMKRLEMEDFDELIEAAKSGTEIKITQ